MPTEIYAIVVSRDVLEVVLFKQTASPLTRFLFHYLDKINLFLYQPDIKETWFLLTVSTQDRLKDCMCCSVYSTEPQSAVWWNLHDQNVFDISVWVSVRTLWILIAKTCSQVFDMWQTATSCHAAICDFWCGFPRAEDNERGSHSNEQSHSLNCYRMRRDRDCLERSDMLTIFPALARAACFRTMLIHWLCCVRDRAVFTMEW